MPASFNVIPTHTFKEKLDINPVKGVELTLYHAPGETNDQIIIWWPEKRILFPADNIYRAFPNLYAIRGTSARYHATIFYMQDVTKFLNTGFNLFEYVIFHFKETPHHG